MSSVMIASKRNPPLLIVVSAPSGAGKTTLCDRLLQEHDDIVYSISCTTRALRGEEVDGEDYYFLSDEQFKQRMQKCLFLEHAAVHGYKYGTLKETVHGAMSEGNSVLMDIDVQGARQIREIIQLAPDGDMMKSGYTDIFIQPPSIDTLKERLEGRGEDSAHVIAERLKNAEEEMSCADEFKYVIVKEDLELAYMKLRDVFLDAEGV